MTEEDTIRVLTRPSFYDMMKLYRTGAGHGSYDTWFSKYGWTWDEFVKHWKEWNGGMSTYSDFEKSNR